MMKNKLMTQRIWNTNPRRKEFQINEGWGQNNHKWLA